MEMKCVDAMSEINSIENADELSDELREKEITISCKPLDKNSIDSSEKANDLALDHEQEHAMISFNGSTKGHGFQKVSSCHSLQNSLPILYFHNLF